MNITIDIVKGLNGVVKKIEQERQTDACNQRKQESYKHVANPRRANRFFRNTTIRLDADFVSLITNRNLNVTQLLLQQIQSLLVCFELLRILRHFNLILRLLTGDAFVVTLKRVDGGRFAAA